MSILQRIDGERFSRVLPAWEGRTVVLIGGGASLTREQVALIEAAHAADKVNVIAVNDAYLWAPFADVQYAADSHWHCWHTQGIAKPLLRLSADQVREAWSSFKGQKCTIENSGANVKDEAVHMMRNRHHPDRGVGLSLDPLVLVTGFHSGFQALNLAILARASVVVLVGYDGHPGEERGHFHGAHPQPTHPSAYEHYRRAYSAAEHEISAAGAVVINATPGSAIDSFPKVSLAEAI